MCSPEPTCLKIMALNDLTALSMLVKNNAFEMRKIQGRVHPELGQSRVIMGSACFPDITIEKAPCILEASRFTAFFITTPAIGLMVTT
jgi:hypothetical protein